MNREMTHTFHITLRIKSMMSMLRTEDKDMLLQRIESLIYAMDEDDIIDMHSGLVEDYPEMFAYLADDEADMIKIEERIKAREDDNDIFHGDIINE